MTNKKAKKRKCYYCPETKGLIKLIVGSGTISNPRKEILVCKKHKDKDW